MIEVGTRVGFRIILTTPEHRRSELTVHGRVTSINGQPSELQILEAMNEIEQIVNEQLSRVRMHISTDTTGAL